MVEDVEYVVVKFDYNAKEPHELTIRKGERLRLLTDTHNWYKVQYSLFVAFCNA
jgi:hypothetical protein